MKRLVNFKGDYLKLIQEHPAHDEGEPVMPAGISRREAFSKYLQWHIRQVICLDWPLKANFTRRQLSNERTSF